ncbi:MAG: response regulator [Candidatus Sericytochromatia bacterium]|nr:response regulator [Candidatus Sericytochromatia bacterium]
MPQHTILIVDDEQQILDLLVRTLGSEHRVITATNGEAALTLLEKEDVDLILTDQRMPDMSGVEFLAHAQAIKPSAMRLVLTGYADLDDIIAAVNEGHIYGYVSKPWDTQELRLMVARALQAYALSQENQRLAQQIQFGYRQTLGTLIAVLEARDAYTGGHSERVSTYARAIAKQIGLTTAEQELIAIGALLHDIGKIGIRENVLCKPDRLTTEERAHIRTHARIGANIIAQNTDLLPVRPMVLHHHEMINGHGYPDGMLGEEIPFFARIVAVADCYDALTTTRPYRVAMPHDDARAVLMGIRGRQLDKDLVDAFMEHIESGDGRQGRSLKSRTA